MIGMVYKDFLVLRKQISYYLIFFAIYAVLTVTGVFPPIVLTVLLTLVGMMLPMSSFGYDDQARWDKYAAATPAGRRGVVAGKYLFSLCCIFGGAVVVSLLQMALSLTGLIQIDLTEQIFATVGCILAVLLINAVILPLLIKFGAEKSRTISMIFFVAIFGGAMLVSTLVEKGGPLPEIPGWLLTALPMVLGLAAVGGYIISYFIALGMMEKKEL